MAGGLALPPMGGPSQQQYTATQQELDSFMEDGNFADMLNEPTLMGNTETESNSTMASTFLTNDFDQFLASMPLAPQEAVPMQQPTPMMSQPHYRPDISMGPSWAPNVGYYFPALPALPFQPLQLPSFPPLSEGFTPAFSTAPPESAMPSRISTPVPPAAPSRHRGRTNKPKYGPGVYLKEQAESKSGQGRVVSISQADYTSKAKQRDDRAAGITPNAFHRKRDAPSIVQTCVCSDKPTYRVKRPKNAFILYRSANAKRLMRQTGNRNQQVSKLAADMWHSETLEVREKFANLAKEEAERHAMMYPDYQYRPGETARNRFGSTSCTCGAYQINMAAMIEKQRQFIAGDDGGQVTQLEESDEYMPPRNSRQRTNKAPTAPMAPPAILPDPSIFGFATPAQHAEATAYVASMKRKQDAAALSNYDEKPIAKRRCPRSSTRKSITYTDPDEDDLFTNVMPAKAERRPASISLSGDNNGSAYSSPLIFDSLPPAVHDSPSHNTRSKSRSLSPPLELDADLENIDWDELFGASPKHHSIAAESDDDGNDDDDNIVVAPRRSSRRSNRSLNKSASPKIYSLRNKTSADQVEKRRSPRRSS